MLKTPRGFFITGTDTGIGKTFVSGLLCQAFKKTEKICYFKPIQTGCETDDDTNTLIKTVKLFDGEWCEPSYRLKAPLSPDRAAAKENINIFAEKILNDFSLLHERFLIVEGAGGLEVPVTSELRFSGLMKKMGLPLIIVSSTRLGTINQTLLTVQRALLLGLEVQGVILNGPEDPGLQEVLEREGIRVLLTLPFCEQSVDKALSIVENAVAEGLFKPTLQKDLSVVDKKNVWHPFTQYGFDREFPQIVSGQGSVLELANGEKIIDAISSWWVNLHGHGNPIIAEAIARQAYQLEHAIFSGYTHRPALELTDRLLSQLRKINSQFSRVFFSDNGSTAVEVALKMAYQYQLQTGKTTKNKFLALRGSYHGDTLAAMSVSEREGFHQVFTPLMAPVDFLEPEDEIALDQQDFSDYAAVIFEPLVQGAGGMRFYSPEYLKKFCAKARAQGALVVADEIFTGFFRTGSFFACEQADIQPDLVCLSKGLTGGFLPLSVTVTTSSLFDAFESLDMGRAFLHGHSYTANPIACAAAVASFDLLAKPSCVEQIREIGQWTREEIGSLQEFPLVQNGRSLGTIGAFEVNSQTDYFKNGQLARNFAKACEKRGALVRPLGGTVYTVPPYSISKDEMKTVYKAIRETLFDMERGAL